MKTTSQIPIDTTSQPLDIIKGIIDNTEKIYDFLMKAK